MFTRVARQDESAPFSGVIAPACRPPSLGLRAGAFAAGEPGFLAAGTTRCRCRVREDERTECSRVLARERYRSFRSHQTGGLDSDG